MAELSTEEKAMRWYGYQDIDVKFNDGLVSVEVGDNFSLTLAVSELEYRAELYDEEKYLIEGEI